MGIENKVNFYGQKQIINNADVIIKIDNKFLQVRLIRTEKWEDRGEKSPRFTKQMPRARFVNPTDKNIHYLVQREDLIKLKERNKDE